MKCFSYNSILQIVVSWETKYLSHRTDAVESYFGGLGTPLRTQFVRMWKMFGNPKYWPIIIAFSWYWRKPLLLNSISLFGLYYLSLIEIHFHHFQTFTYPHTQSFGRKTMFYSYDLLLEFDCLSVLAQILKKIIRNIIYDP